MDRADQQKRLLLTIVLSTAVMILWMQFFAPKPPPPGEADAGTPAAAAPADAGTGAVAAAPQPPAPEAAPQGEAAVPVEKVEVATPAQDLTFTNHGAGLVGAVIKNGDRWPGYKFLARGAKGSEPEPVNIVKLSEGQPPLGASEVSGDLQLPLSAAYQAEKTADGVVFRAARGDVAVEKRYTLNKNGYDLRVEYRVTNRSSAPRAARLGIVIPASVDPASQKGGGFFSPPPEQSHSVCRAVEDTERLAYDSDPVKKSFPGPVQFAGYEERYFMAVAYPLFRDGTSCVLSTEPSGAFVGRLEIDLGTLGAGETVTREVGMYLGPKAIEELQRVSQAAAVGAGLLPLGTEPPAAAGAVAGVDPQLSDAVDFGWWAVIARVLLAVMKSFQKVVVNWGVAIILLTLLVKLLLYPLSHKQMESMESMRRLQPQLDALGKKYEKDKEKLNLERMRLFQENKVNPFGGCLPLLVQMPVWIALYQTLLSSFELYREPLLSFWIRDLTVADPFYILPLAMGVTMFITQKMQPQMGDPTQAKVMLYFMPIFFTFIMLSLPAGLTLYIFTNNLLSIAQQKYLQRKFAKKPTA